MKFTLRQIEVFLATAVHKNISKAANELSMSQSAATCALKDFEERYNTQVFDRIGKRLVINEQGKKLLPEAEALLSKAKELESVLIDDTEQGAINIGATLTIGNYIAVPLVAKYKRTYPGITANLHIANTSRIVNEVLNFEMDIGLIEGEFSHKDLEIVKWFDDELIVFVAPEHEYAKEKELKDSDIVLAEWILREKGSGTRQTFDRAMQGLQNQLNIFMELEYTEAILQAVEQGEGVGCLSRICVEDAIRDGRLIELKLKKRSMKRSFYRVVHKKKYISNSLKRWISLIERYH